MSSLPQTWSLSPKQRVEISISPFAFTAAQPDLLHDPIVAWMSDVFTAATSLISLPAMDCAKLLRASCWLGLAFSSTISTAFPLRGSYFMLPSVASVRTTTITLKPSSEVPCQLPSLMVHTSIASLPVVPISALAKHGPVYMSQERTSR